MLEHTSFKQILGLIKKKNIFLHDPISYRYGVGPVGYLCVFNCL